MGQFGLADWEEIADRRDWPILLHGNGASCAVSHRFAYPSLYQAAPLTADDRDIFSAPGTTNFEEVLDHLRTAALICDQVGHDPDDVHDRYDSVREALIEAVNFHHADWVDVDDGGRLRRLRRALRPYDEVYTTCYDLLVYWAIMRGKPPGEGFVDFFWNAGLSFDPLMTSVHADRTAVYFLHGALHLYRGPHGVTKKRTSRSGNLLAQIATPRRSPLFVSEGTAQQKLRSIRRSDYLSLLIRTSACRRTASSSSGNH
jgi:hypothetical protein